MKTVFNHARRGCVACLLTFANPAFSANWLALQGTEPKGTSERAYVSGLVQAEYQKDLSTGNEKGEFIPQKLIGPNLESRSGFQVGRAMVGVRGTGLPLDSRVNYLLLIELGHNGITHNDGARATDASMTVDWLPYLTVRGGLFKYPGSEEGLQSPAVSPYINFSEATQQLMQERFPNSDNFLKTGDRGNTEAKILSISSNGFAKPVGAFRDTGVQIFDTIDYAGWEHTYAMMLGSGNGLNMGDNNENLTQYYYLASERVLSGGERDVNREGVKVFGWMQTGKRSYDTDFNLGSRSIQHFTRTRYGMGVTGQWKAYRAQAEYFGANGMIFLGQHKESFDMNAPGLDTPGNGLKGKASGFYLDGGWRVLDTNFEIDMRYDYVDRLPGDDLEVKFNRLTLATRYFVSKKSSASVNYEIRRAKSVTGNASLQNNYSGLGGRMGIQFTSQF